MSVDHRRLDILVAQKLLNGSDVIAASEQVGGKGMPEGVASSPLGQVGIYHRVPR